MFSFSFLPEHSSKKVFVLLTALRILLFIGLISLFQGLVPLGTSVGVLTLGIVLGVVFSSRLSFSKYKFPTLLTVIGLVFLLAYLYELIFSIFASDSPLELLQPYANYLHLQLILICFSATAILTWFFWKSPVAGTIELILFLVLIIFLLSQHRGYHFDSPLLINTLSWQFGVERLSMLVILGVIATVLSLFYAYASSLPSRPVAKARVTLPIIEKSSKRFHSTVIGSCFIALLIIGVAYEVYNYHYSRSLSLISNGVGQESSQGLSPLGFHSALGATNQPSALVRLEGDYNRNPYSPMLYFRETALSEYNGKELVIAGDDYDKDIPHTSVSEAFELAQKVYSTSRSEVTQSVFSLTDHREAFAIDYPIAIRPLKNPNPQRFRATYEVVSLAPFFDLKELRTLEVGDPKWLPSEKEHYLKPPTDSRYTALSKEITSNIDDPRLKIVAITDYLSKHAIYTLTPNHEVNETDPVAPFLFGNMRGYCVHIAHAVVYLLRIAGIPARIGTGYLTDLSQARDGHILLRMSDRHAWPEVYVKDKGWLPFDVRPEQVESHAETEVDQKLLEELMGMIGPNEIMLDENALKDEPTLHNRGSFVLPLPSWTHLLVIVFMLVLVMLFLKAFILYGWALPLGITHRALYSFYSITSFLHDLGYERDFGETRLEYRLRLNQKLGHDFLSTSDVFDILKYSGKSSSLGLEEIDKKRTNDKKAIGGISLISRIIAYLNPSSLISFFGRGRL